MAAAQPAESADVLAAAVDSAGIGVLAYNFVQTRDKNVATAQA